MDLTTTTRSAHRVAVMQGILPWNRGGVSADVIAGVTLAALAIPEVMGYTSIAGMPVITGLYTILIPLLLFALLGSSRHLVVGADSATGCPRSGWCPAASRASAFLRCLDPTFPHCSEPRPPSSC